MADLKIKHSDGFDGRALVVKPEGLVLRETSFFGGTTKMTFHHVDAVLMSATGLLSLQSGEKVFSIQTKPEKDAHQQAIDALLRGVRATVNPAR